MIEEMLNGFKSDKYNLEGEIEKLFFAFCEKWNIALNDKRIEYDNERQRVIVTVEL